jgi:peroxiredoxin
VSECRSKFAVAADVDQTVMKQYDAVLAQAPQYANRTSYVIAPDGTIVYAYTSLKPDLHVQNTLDALKAWEAAHPAK